MRLASTRSAWFGQLLLAGTLLGAGLGACTIVNGNHCALNAGACGEGLVCDRCAVDNDGCVSPNALTAESCLVEDSATGTGSTSSPTTTLTTTTVSTSTTTSTTEPTTSVTDTTGEPTTGSTTDVSGSSTTIDPTEGFTCDPQTPANFECKQKDPKQPYCVETDTCGSCVELVSSSCADIDATNPACDAALGTCVECTADNTQACNPNEVCNQYINDCDQCFEHDQCISGACNLKTGNCFPPQNVVWVERQASCIGKDGTEMSPFCTLVEALALWNDKDMVIKLKPGLGPQIDPIELKSGKNVAIIGVGSPKIGAVTSPEPRINVVDNTNLFLARVRLQDATQASQFINCPSGFSDVWIDESVIMNNKVPFQTAGCGMLTLRRSVVTANTGASNVEALTMINSFMSSNKVGNSGPPMRINDVSTIVHSTIVDNAGSISSAFYCSTPKDIVVRNSVILGDNKPLGGCTPLLENSYVGMAADLVDLFQAAQQGVFRPKPAADAISTLAEWQIGDPYVDYDGELRPNEAGAKDFAGAARP